MTEKLSFAFQSRFAAYAIALSREVKLFLEARNTGRKTRADRKLIKQHAEIIELSRAKAISYGAAVSLLVEAIGDHQASTKKVKMSLFGRSRPGHTDYSAICGDVSRLRGSDARLYRALQFFLYNEKQAWASFCSDVPLAVETDLSNHRRGFIDELKSEGFVVFEEADEIRVRATDKLLQFLNTPTDIPPDETPLYGDINGRFKPN